MFKSNKKLLVLLIMCILFSVSSITIFADSNVGGVVTIDSSGGDLVAGKLQERIEATGIFAVDVTELYIGNDVNGELNDDDIAYINTFANIEVLDVANTITVGDVGDDFFNDQDSITEVTFPAITLGLNSFMSCDKLETISLPEAITFEGINLVNCDVLTTVELPKAEVFGDYFLMNCYEIETIVLPEAISFGDNPFYSCLKLSTVTLPNATIFGDAAFYYGYKLVSVDLPVATTFGDDAFYNCNELVSVNLPKATTFGDLAFSNCNELVSVSLSEAITFGNDAFRQSQLLTTAILPKATTFGDKAFYNCSALQTVDLSEATTFGADAFISCRSLVTVDLPEATTFGDGAFGNCNELTSVDFPKATTFHGDAFSNCSKLITIDLPQVMGFGGEAFENCIELTTTYLPEVVTFGDKAFFNCTNLEAIVLPNVTAFGDDAFNNCTKLITVDLPKVITFDDNAFYDCSNLITTGDFPEATTFGNNAFYGCHDITSINLPKAITFGDNAFERCYELKTIVMPKVTEFGTGTFTDCYVDDLTLGYTVPTVGAFDVPDTIGRPITLNVPNSVLFDFDNDDVSINNKWHDWDLVALAVCTVDFNSQDGSTVVSQTVDEGYYATEPTDPTKNDYTFDGWYKSTAFGVYDKWDFDDFKITQNIILYAKWLEIGNTIPDLIDTVSATTSTSITINDSYTLNLSTIFKDDDGDNLNYKVAVNGATEIAANENYSYSPSSTGLTNLEFKANDGSEDSVDTYFVEITVSGSSSTTGSSSRKTVIVNDFTTKVPSNIIGKDKDFEVSKKGVKVKINGLSLSEHKGDDVEIFIQRIDSSYFNLDIIGEFLEGIPVFDISLIADGTKVPFSSDILLEIEFEVEGDYENHKMVASYIAEDGTCEILEGVYNNGKLMFKTNHLSHYTLLYVDKSFKDCQNHWSKVAIEALASREVVKGVGDELFNPDGEITRAEFVTMVVRYFNLKAYGTDLGYTDVEDDSWYAEYVWIGRENDIIPDNYGDQFEPNKAITREEMMYILYKSLEATNRLNTLDDNGDKLAEFVDSDDVSDYAKEASEYLISRDVINGDGNGILTPLATSTRAEVAQMVYNIMTMTYR